MLLCAYLAMPRSVGSIVLIIIAVIIGLVLIVYAAATYTGVAELPSRTSSSTIMSTSSTTFLVNPRFLLPSAREQVNENGERVTEDTTRPAPPPSRSGFFGNFFSRITRTNDEIPAGYTQADLSPYWQQVTISSVRTNRSTRPTTNPNSVSLKHNAGDASIAISGWQLKSNRSGVTIPRGIRLYRTTPTPLENIELRKGETATLYTNSSPLGAGSNFVLNKCVGYLSAGYPFNPPLPTSCVRPAKRDIETFMGACQDYILKLRTCQTGDPNVSAARDDSSCRSYIASTINYDGCVKRYQNEANFYLREWRVWLGSNFLDPLHDRVLLLDANGKVVDSYTY